MSQNVLGVPLAALQKPRRRSKLARQRARTGALFAAPLALFVLLLFIVPLLTMLQMAFSDWTLLGGDRGFAGVANFVRATQDGLLGPAVFFTLLYTALTTVILLPVSLGLALLLQRTRRLNSVLRTAILLPSALGLASAALLFYGLYSPTIGPLGDTVRLLGASQEPVSLLETPTSALWSTIALVLWRFVGFNMLLLMIGLQGIPDDLYEAAHIDGASRWQTFHDVTLPLLRPSIALALILSVTGSLLAFDQFYILTKGGPDNSTVTIVQVIYRTAFQKFDLGTSAAESLVLMLALVLLNVIQLRALRGKDT